MRRTSPWRKAGRIFIAGLLTVLPIVATLYFTLWVLGILEGFFGKQVMLLVPDGWYRTGMGLLAAIVFVFAVGLRYTVFVPRSAVAVVNMSREDAMKFILTAGLKTAPPQVEPPGGGPRKRRAAARAPARTPLS